MTKVTWALPDPLPQLLLDEVRSALHSDAATPIILIDGLSGSGKTSLAHALAAQLQREGSAAWRIIGPDLWFPGWDGLEEAQETTLTLMENLRRGQAGVYRPWDWQTSQMMPARKVPPGVPTVIEGCGALTPRTAQLADVTIWTQALGGGAQRKARALSRDGDTYAPWWKRWEAQDLARLEKDHPSDFADILVYT